MAGTDPSTTDGPGETTRWMEQENQQTLEEKTPGLHGCHPEKSNRVRSSKPAHPQQEHHPVKL